MRSGMQSVARDVDESSLRLDTDSTASRGIGSRVGSRQDQTPGYGAVMDAAPREPTKHSDPQNCGSVNEADIGTKDVECGDSREIGERHEL